MNDIIQIPGFEIIEKIGAGGMATVWKARQVSLDRIVAIKIMNAQLALDPADIQRFQSEAQAAAKLKHQGIVQVYDANVDGGMYYFVMEYVAGYTVGDWVRRKGILTEKDALLVADCVADALEYAWNTARIIHCDIKPDNIMIDADGTVKVADLGLARTINAMSFSEEFTDEVLGTPAYISPEQATGNLDLDFRADIYSLGAMMYHLVTGKLMFTGHPDDKVLEMQVSDQVEDPIDINPHLTKGMCTVLEKMLAKNKDDRYASWEAVRADIAKVKKKVPFVGAMLPDGASSIKRSTKRMPATHGGGPATKHAEAVAPESQAKPVMQAIGVAAALVVVLLIWLIITALNRQPPSDVPGKTSSGRQAVPPRQPNQRAETEEDRIQKLLDGAREFASQNPEKYDEAVRRFQEVVNQGRGTRYGSMALDEVKRINGLKAAQAEKVLNQLRETAEELAAQKKFAEAAEKCERYDGPFASDTSGKRMMLASEFRNRQRALEEDERKKKQEAETRFKEVLDKAVAQLFAAGAAAAESVVSESMSDQRLAQRIAELESVRTAFSEAANIDKKIMESFKVHKGEDIIVNLAVGPRKYTIMDAREGKVTARQRIGETGSVVVSLEAKDLAMAERLQRMGPDDAPGVAIVKGLLFFNQRQMSHAKRYFGLVNQLLAPRLLAHVEASDARSASDDAKNALASLMKTAGISGEPYDRQVWLAAISKMKFGKDGDPKLQEAIAEFRKTFGQSEFMPDADAILKAIETAMQEQKGAPVVPAQPQPPVPPAGVDPLPGLPPLKAIPLPPKIAEAAGNKAAVAQLLLDRNTELAGEDIVITDKAGKPYRVDIISPDVLDILPVAALKDIKEFACGSVAPQYAGVTEPRCRLYDISALRGMQLEYVYLGLVNVSDLTSLQGMPVKSLIIPGSEVADLRPVRGMPLEKLNIRNTKIKDLSSLKGMRIREFDAANTKITDYSVLAGMPIERMDLSGSMVRDISFLKDMQLRDLHLGHTKILNIQPLKGMSLSYLNLEYTQIKDLTPIKDVKLSSLNLGNSEVTDLSPLKGMALASLSVANTQVKDFSAIKGMPLRHLSVNGTRFDDLNVVKECPLEHLDIAATKVFDLSPISEIPLRSLNVAGSAVRDLKPIVNMPLVTFNCWNSPTLDLSPLRRSSIEDIWIDPKMQNDENTMRILRSMPKLRSVNGTKIMRHGMEMRPGERGR